MRSIESFRANVRELIKPFLGGEAKAEKIPPNVRAAAYEAIQLASHARKLLSNKDYEEVWSKLQEREADLISALIHEKDPRAITLLQGQLQEIRFIQNLPVQILNVGEEAERMLKASGEQEE